MAKKKLSYERTKARKQKQKDKELEAHLAAQRLEEDRQKEEVRYAERLPHYCWRVPNYDSLTYYLEAGVGSPVSLRSRPVANGTQGRQGSCQGGSARRV